MAMVICCLSVIAGSTVAYVRTKTVAQAAVTTGKIDITLNNNSVPSETPVASSDTDYMEMHLGTLAPGDKLNWNITVTNEKDSAIAYIRLKYDDEITEADSASEVLEITENEYWTYKDGWYYYNEAVEGGETTESLFDAINVKVDLDNSVRGADGIIRVYAQSVQRANNGKNVMEAQGWPAIPKT